jgi:hypothetical protein
MRPFLGLPELNIMPLYSLQPHEYIDEHRVGELMRLLEEENILRNPPVVMPLDERETQFVVLDGASRMAAFDRMANPHILVQVVRQGEWPVLVETWHHVVLGVRMSELISSIERLQGIALIPHELHEVERELQEGIITPFLMMADGGIFQVGHPNDSLETQVMFLNQFADIYRLQGRVERTSSIMIDRLKDLYPDFCCLILLPKFSVEEVLRVTRAGLLFPAGLTRFVITPRALRVNYPVDWLRSNRPIEEKREQLSQWLRDEIARRKIRFYSESTFLFDD